MAYAAVGDWDAAANKVRQGKVAHRALSGMGGGAMACFPCAALQPKDAKAKELSGLERSIKKGRFLGGPVHHGYSVR